jgi:hypothetical protein
MGKDVGGARVPSNGEDVTTASTADPVLFALSNRTSEEDDDGWLSDGLVGLCNESRRLIGFTAGGGMEMLALSTLPADVISASAVRPFLLLVADEADERLWVLPARNWELLAALSLEEVRSRASMRAAGCQRHAVRERQDWTVYGGSRDVRCTARSSRGGVRASKSSCPQSARAPWTLFRFGKS